MNRKTIVRAPTIHSARLDIIRVDPQAEIPYRLDSTCYSVALVKRSDGRTEDDVNEVNYYDLGLKINPIPGHVVEITATPDLVSQGYLLAGPVRIFNSESIEELDEVRIGLYKFRETDDLDCPFACLNMTLTELKQPSVNVIRTGNERELVPEKKGRFNVAGSRVAAKSHYQ